MRARGRSLPLLLALGALAAPHLAAQTPERPSSPTSPTDPRTPAPGGRLETDPLQRRPTLEREPLERESPFRISVAPRRSNPLLAGLPACVRYGNNSGRTDLFGAPGSGSACVAANERAPSTPPGELPAMSWDFATSGGVAPVTIRVSVPRNPELASLFSVEGPGPVIPRSTSRLETHLREGEPAGDVRRVIRFRGMPYTADVPREILVSVEAKDGAGTVKGTDFRLYPYSPRVAAARTASRTARLWGALTVELDGLGLATSLERESTSVHAAGHCLWSEIDPVDNGAIEESTIALGAHDGTYSLARFGWISDSARSDGAFTCRLLTRIRLRFPLMAEDAQEPVLVLASPSPLAFDARQTYRITRTWALRGRFGLFPGNGLGSGTGLGTCSGTSVGPLENYAVGVQEHEGDLSFRIRSGPAGTECRFVDVREQALRLPNGFELESSDWTKDSTDKCGLGQHHVEEAFDFSRSGFTVAPTELGTVAGMAPTLYDPENSGITLRTDSQREFRTVVRPILVWLWCDKTAVNDHQVRMTLTEATFTGPAGADFP